MELVEGAKPLTLDEQYFAPGNTDIFRTRFFDFGLRQVTFLCRVKSYPHLTGAADEFNHLRLIDPSWGDCGEMELVDLDSNQTQVRFYLPGRFPLSELEKYESVIRRYYSQQRIALWFYENMGWTSKVIELFAEELYEHRVTSLRKIENFIVDRMGLKLYPMSCLQFPPSPQTGISQTQPDCPMLQAGISLPPWIISQRPVGISQIEPYNPWTQVGISQIQPGNSDQPVRISQLPHDDPQLQKGISQMQPDTRLAQAEVDRDIPRQHPMDDSDIPFTIDDQELLRLWNDGLAVKKIGLRIGKADKTIATRLSVLRGMYGEERVPLRKQPTRKA
jgi:hypothetical protein